MKLPLINTMNRDAPSGNYNASSEPADSRVPVHVHAPQTTGAAAAGTVQNTKNDTAITL